MFLAHWSNRPFSSLQLPGIEYDIKDSPMVHTRDLDAFTVRVDELLKWRESYDSKVYLAPYFALIQSSGTGKTKLMHEYYKKMTMMDTTDVHVELILCTSGDATKMGLGDDIFSTTLDLFEYRVGEEGLEKLRNRLYELTKTGKKNIVLLFDESQHLV